MLVSKSLLASDLEKWLLMPGDVAASHAEIESECALCHAPLSDVPQGELCVDCHTNVGIDVAKNTGFHGRLPAAERMECAQCHTDHEGRDMNIAEFDHSLFDHTLTDFVLTGAHADAACGDCHAQDEAFAIAPTQCQSCHAKDDVHKGQFEGDCGSCHVSANWQEAAFDHNLTDFALLGAHTNLSCSSCHTKTSFAEVGEQCVDCHQADDVHQGRNGSDCASCHNSASWSSVLFDHFAVSGFGLVGGHAGLGCTDCHQKEDHSDLGGSTCQSCHSGQDVHKGRFGTNCASCHNVFEWTSLEFDHTAKTGFALPKGHGRLSCESCHAGKLTDPIATTCGSCHEDDDVHKSQLGSDCQSCHIETSWTAKLWFDHAITRFPLIGKHAEVSCDQCHATAAFHDAGEECVACHRDDDPHRGSLGNQCDTCHNPVSWQFWHFDHDKHTQFPLTGMHSDVSCDGCHLNTDRPGLNIKSDCNSCHGRDDPHRGRFGNNCETCHTTSSFATVEDL